MKNVWSSNVFSPLCAEKIPKDVVELNGIEPPVVPSTTLHRRRLVTAPDPEQSVGQRRRDDRPGAVALAEAVDVLVVEAFCLERRGGTLTCDQPVAAAGRGLALAPASSRYKGALLRV